MNRTQFNLESEIQISAREMLDENIFDKEEGENLKVKNSELTKKLEEKNIIIKYLIKEKEKILEQKERVLEEKEKNLSKKEEIIKNLQNELVGMG